MSARAFNSTVGTAAVAVAFAAGLVASGALFAASDIKASPAFTPAQLTALPTTAWITNGGTVFNQRYSPLKQLDRTTVKDLKAVWRASLGGSGLGRQSSGQAQMLAYEGVL
jgi:glucose dehydrogenase